jgi:DNA-directed RNA polymerase specialized sigma subunit
MEDGGSPAPAPTRRRNLWNSQAAPVTPGSGPHGTLIHRYLPLAWGMARKAQLRCGLPGDELASEAALALVETARDFVADPNLDEVGSAAQFAALARARIKGRLSAYIRTEGHRIPDRLARTKVQVERACDHLRQVHSRPPKTDEIAVYTGIDSGTVRTARHGLYSPSPLPADGPAVAGSGTDSVDDPADPAELVELMVKRCGSLGSKVLTLRYGLDGQSEPMSLRAIALELDLDRDTVRRAHIKALQSIAARCRERGLTLESWAQAIAIRCA